MSDVRWRRRLKGSRVLLLGCLIVAAIVSAAALAPWLAAHDPQEMDMSRRLQPPSPEHLLGTDQYGRDLWARILFGARLSLQVGALSVAVSAAVGIAVGLVAGYYGGVVDLVLMRLVDIFLAFPALLLAIALVAALGPGTLNTILAISLVYWTQYARVVRANTLAAVREEYAEAARALGISSLRIMVRHVLPNVLAPAVVIASLGFGHAVVAESALSFLGLGVQPPEPSWGWTLAFGMRFLRMAPHLSIFPGLAIALTVLGFNLLGDGLRDAMDPRSAGRSRG